ncbi:MAG: CHRD domain-containing protein [Armatimonadota bacterium]
MRTVCLVIAILSILLSTMGVATAQAPRGLYVAYLSGDEEVPRVTTTASGLCAFELTPQGLRYWVQVFDLENTMQGHIHIGAAGTNGAVAVWLYPAAPPPVQIQGRANGVIGEGVITAARFVGPLARQQMPALITAIEAGNAYCNVHTARFGGGEIRGQIR